jgi:hypothetical protein
MNEDLKAKMREALDARKRRAQAHADEAPLHEKVHGSEVAGGSSPQVHRRKAGGGGS